MRRILIILTAALLVLAGWAYYYFSGRTYVYEFSETQIKEKLSQMLPMTRRYLFIFEVTLDNPRVKLIEGSDRVSAGLDIVLNIHVNDNPVPLGGTIDVSGSVAYDATRGAFFLTDPHVDGFKVQGVPEKYTARVSSIVTDALSDYYRERPVYTLSRKDMKQLAARLVLRDVRVKDKKLVATLGI
jgi:hypothetical protein